MASLLHRARHHIRHPGDLALLPAMAVLAGALPFLLRWLSLPRLLALLGWVNRCFLAPLRPREDRVLHFADALARVDRWSWRNNCVVRGLLYFAFLNSRARPVQVRFGVARRRAADAAGPGRRHVWVVRDGAPVNESLNVSDYEVLFGYPSTAGGDAASPPACRFGEEDMDSP
jgi:hypothetical protein